MKPDHSDNHNGYSANDPALNTRTYLSAPVKLLTLFVLLAGIPSAALGWLGWRLLQQDRALENQRERDRLERAAVLLANELERGLMLRGEFLNAFNRVVFGAPVANASAANFGRVTSQANSPRQGRIALRIDF